MIDNSNIGKAYADHQRQEELLTASDLNYTIVRPVGLSNQKSLQLVRQSLNGIPKPNLLISRMAVGKFLVDALEWVDLERQIVTISKV